MQELSRSQISYEVARPDADADVPVEAGSGGGGVGGFGQLSVTSQISFRPSGHS